MSSVHFNHNCKHSGTDHSISVTRQESSGTYRVYYQKVEYPYSPVTVDKQYPERKIFQDTLLIQKRIMNKEIYEVHTLFQYPEHKGKEVWSCLQNCNKNDFMTKWKQYEKSYSLETEMPNFYTSDSKIKKEVIEPVTSGVKEDTDVDMEIEDSEDVVITIKNPTATKKTKSKSKKNKKKVFTENYYWEESQKNIHWKPCELRFDIDGWCYSMNEFKQVYKKDNDWFELWNIAPVAFSCKDDTYKTARCYFSEELEDEDYDFIISSLKTYRKYLKKQNPSSIIIIE